MPLGVGDDDLGARQPQRVQQKVALVGGVHRGGHRADARGTQPEVDPLRAGRREQRDGVAPADTHVGQRISGGAGPLLASARTSRRPGDRHQHPVGKLLGAPVQHGRDGEVLDTEMRRTDRPVRPAGIRHPQPPGPVHRRRCTRSRRARALCPGRSDAPSAAAPRSRGPPPAPGWASPGTSCSPR